MQLMKEKLRSEKNFSPFLLRNVMSFGQFYCALHSFIVLRTVLLSFGQFYCPSDSFIVLRTVLLLRSVIALRTVLLLRSFIAAQFIASQ